MNPTPTGGSAVPSPDGDAPARDGEPSAVPGPRSGVHPLPHRRGARDRTAGGPEGRRSGAPDEATLHRLLTGLREI